VLWTSGRARRGRSFASPAVSRRRPLLDGAARHVALRRVAEIADALDRDPDAWPLSRADDPAGLRSASLASGRAGLALFHAWAARAGADANGEARAATRLGEAFDLVASRTMNASLFCGFTGVAWVAHLLTPQGEEDPVAEVDDALLGALDDDGFAPPYDLIDGLAGIGVYALARLPRPAARRMAERVVDRLAERASAESVGRSWRSGAASRRALASGVATTADAPYWNLGLAHGVPGALGFLARALRAGVRATQARALLEDGAAWLVAQRLPAGAGGAFADFVAEDVPPEPARLAWCYGDPGAALGLLAAARALERADLESVALDVARLAARRPLEGSAVVDTGLCHGSAGLAHVFHRLARATGDATCLAAARRWLAETLVPRPERGGVAGFATYSFERVREGEYVEDPCLLTGAAGVGLALLAATTDVPPAWDAAFLMDVT